MSGMDLIFQLLGLLLGLSIAELLAGLARSWRINVGAAHSSDNHVRIGWLVPLLGTRRISGYRLTSCATSCPSITAPCSV